ncbi:Tat pathway signal sequence domain protein [Streptomyces thinghirensis]|nr:Tat pathway signal sequence domain protein [Streptomyces thinghirensis]
MRRTILSAVALACTAVLAATAPAFADDPTPVPSTRRRAGAEPRHRAERGAVALRQLAGPGGGPSRAPADGQVSTVPEGAPDTGVAAPASSGTDEGLIGAGAGGGARRGRRGPLVVRRRRQRPGV